MQATELKMQFEEQNLVAVILSYADSNHYLAGGVDTQGNYYLLENRKGSTETFNSMREAEVTLAELGAENAIFEMETAYDEMIGNSKNERCKMMVHLVH